LYPVQVIKRGFWIVPSLSSCHEKATVALYFGEILTRLGVADFLVSSFRFAT